MKRTTNWERLRAVLAALCLFLWVAGNALEMVVVFYRFHYDVYFTLPEWIGAHNILSWMLLLLSSAAFILPLEDKRRALIALSGLYTVAFFCFYVGGEDVALFRQGNFYTALALATVPLLLALGRSGQQRFQTMARQLFWLPAALVALSRIIPWWFLLSSFKETVNGGDSRAVWIYPLVTVLLHIIEAAAVLFIGWWSRAERMARTD